MNRRPLLAWTSGLMVLALSLPGLVAAATLSQGLDPQADTFTLKGHVVAQGRTDQQQTIQLALRLDTKEPVVTNYPDLKTDENGEFSFDVKGIKGDPYTWRVKGAQTLATSGSFELGTVDVLEMGTQLTGDANNDNRVNIVDFSMLRATFSKQVGDDGYDTRADFTGDGRVSIQDWNLLRGNIGRAGDPPLE